MAYVFTDENGYVQRTVFEESILSAEEKSKGLYFSSIPEPTHQIGKIHVGKIDSSGNYIYEYVDRPDTIDDKVERLVHSDKTADQKYKELDITTATIEEVRSAKIEQLKEACTLTIFGGFTSTSTGNSFGFNSHDQLNFNSQLNKVNLWKNQLSDGVITQTDYDAKFPISWKSKDAGVVSLTEAQFISVLDDAEKHLMSQQTKYWTLEAQALSATTKDEIDAIVW